MADLQALLSENSWLIWLGVFLMTVIITAAFGAGWSLAQLLTIRRQQLHPPAVDEHLTRINGGLDDLLQSTAQLQEARSNRLTHDDLRQLQDRCNQLLDLITSDELEALVHFDTETTPRLYQSKVLELNWDLSPESETTGLPNRTAFDENLRKLLDAGQQHDAQSGLLLIKIEKFAHLVRRLGKDTRILKWKMARVLCRSLRECDVVCQFDDDAFAVLMPGVSDKLGTQLAQAIRDSVRFHRFRVSESDDEILLTASFGLTFCRPLEPVDLLLNRAGDALEKSMRRGRNRLTIQEAVPPPVSVSSSAP